MVFLKDILHAKLRFPHINFFKIVLVISALAVAFSAVYYLVIFLPEKERMKLEWEKEAATAEANRKAADETYRRLMLDACLADADSNYSTNWENSCKVLGKAKDCSLPSDTADRWDKLHKQDRDECYKRYP